MTCDDCDSRRVVKLDGVRICIDCKKGGRYDLVYVPA